MKIDKKHHGNTLHKLAEEHEFSSLNRGFPYYRASFLFFKGCYSLVLFYKYF